MKRKKKKTNKSNKKRSNKKRSNKKRSNKKELEIILKTLKNIKVGKQIEHLKKIKLLPKKKIK